AGQPFSFAMLAANLAVHDLPVVRLFSHSSSAVSSASFPEARLSWHLMMHATSFPVAFDAFSSHLAVSLLGAGTKPVSSPPNGGLAAPAAMTNRPTDIAAAADANLNMVTSFSLDAAEVPSLRLGPRARQSPRSVRRTHPMLLLTCSLVYAVLLHGDE